MNYKFIFKRIIFVFLPYGIFVWLRKIKLPVFNRKKILFLCRPNINLKDIHSGKRCFIVCNGPSVNKQNLKPLKNEFVFSVSSGYHHKDYALIQPRYHCVPQITYGLISENDVVKWLSEMQSKIGGAEVFLNYTEHALVQKYKLFPNKKISYLFMHGLLKNKYNGRIDISGQIPSVQSVPVMCIMIAMFMGFNRIYLLGTDHDSFRTGEYKYFYNPTVLKDKDFMAVKNDDLFLKQEEFLAYSLLWQQYRKINEIAINNSISIYNATLGGALDIFERLNFDELF